MLNLFKHMQVNLNCMMNINYEAHLTLPLANTISNYYYNQMIEDIPTIQDTQSYLLNKDIIIDLNEVTLFL